MQSHRHSHYGKDRLGFTLDEEWTGAVGAAGNTLRAGLWFEDSTRILGRDWHRILDPTLNMNFDETPYWQQYDWDFPQQVFKWYVEDTVYAGPLAISGGVKQFLVNVSCRDLFGIDPGLAVDSDSDLLLSGGVALETPVEGLELFAGYTENFKALASGPEPRRPPEMPGRPSFYTAWTFNDSQYVGTGDALADASQNIQPGSDVTGVPEPVLAS